MDWIIAYGLFSMGMGALTTLIALWLFAPKEFKELMKAIRTFKKKAR